MKNKLMLVINVVFFSPIYLMADTGKAIDPNYLSNYLQEMVLVVGGIVVLGTFAFLLRFTFILIEVQQRRILIEQGIEIPTEKEKSGPTLWERLSTWAVGLKPMEKEADIMLDHDYDGIKELDNSLPPWWVAMFYITVAIAAGYWGYFAHYEVGLSSADEYALEMRYAKEAQARYLEQQANTITESNVTVLVDAAALSAGAAIYKNNCVACHGPTGGGGVGPNLTDAYWLHGSDIKSIFKTIKYGVPDKGMIAWKSQLRPAAIHEISSYLMTLKGTNVPNGKEPQGELIEESVGNEVQDSIKTKIGMK